MPNEHDELKQMVTRLNQRLRNLELLALGILIGVGVYVTRAADSWFEINTNQAILFGLAFSICLLLLFWRQWRKLCSPRTEWGRMLGQRAENPGRR